MDVLSGGVETTVQHLPGRLIGLGMPRSGPMDPLAFTAANLLVSNDPFTEALEVTLTGCKLHFHAAAVVAVCGAPMPLTVDGKAARMWEKVVVPAGGRLVLGVVKERGMRAYVAVRGGFPGIPKYLGSKSTSMGLGGYQVRGSYAFQ
jgi:urea carboxylase